MANGFLSDDNGAPAVDLGPKVVPGQRGVSPGSGSFGGVSDALTPKDVSSGSDAPLSMNFNLGDMFNQMRTGIAGLGKADPELATGAEGGFDGLVDLLGGGTTDGAKSKAGVGDDLSTEQALGLGAASTALQTAAAFGANRDAHAAALDRMRDDFDRAFGSVEFDQMLWETQQENNSTRELIQIMNETKRQNQGAASQTLTNQTQQFTRDPSTGGVI